jgi:hypothetical protein
MAARRLSPGDHYVSEAVTSPAVVNWAARSVIGSSAQAASLSAAPANLSEAEQNRRRLTQALTQRIGD